MRYQTDMCRLQHSGYGGTVHYPTPFAEPAIVIGTVDESLENSGATWSYTKRKATNQFSFVCDLTSDGYMWFAMEPGVHEVDGKMVQAGQLDSATTHDTVFFPALFAEPPIIFTLPAGSNAYSRVIGTPATGGFDVYADTAGQPLNWIAMEPGLYRYGPYTWEVGQFADPDNGDFLPFETDFGGIPGVVFTVQDTDNSGAVSTRTHGLSSEGATLYLNSDASEFLNYIAFMGPQ
ncbi:MAG: hypothetical protein ACI8PZ_000611 [Myxococcota bacterium]|jgi:hypothetical protein